MKPLHSHIIFLVLAAAVALMVGATFGFMYHSVGSSVEGAVTAAEAVEAALTSKDREAQFMQVYQATASKWAELPGFFVPADKVVAFVESLEALGPSSGSSVSIGALATLEGKKSAAGVTGSVSARVTASGTWRSVMKALSLAENLPYKASIDNLRLDETESSLAGSALSAGKAKESAWTISFDVRAPLLSDPIATKK